MGESEEQKEPAFEPAGDETPPPEAPAGKPWVRPLLGGMALGLCILAIVTLVLLLRQGPSSSERDRTAAPEAQTTRATGPSATTPAASYAIFAWKDARDVLHRAAIDKARYEAFVVAERQAVEQDKQRLNALQVEKLRSELSPAFEEVDDRVPAYADWAFDWWTSWILLGRGFVWTWESLKSGYLLTVPDRVQAQLVGAIQEQFMVLVLKPDLTEPKLTAALDRSSLALRDAMMQSCIGYERARNDFVKREAHQVERLDPAQGWLPDTAWNRGAAEFRSLCDPAVGIDDSALRGEFRKLVQLRNADGPVDEVILRLARPFATKLISFVVLPVIVTAIVGGFVLPLFGLLPSVLSNVIIGVLTGALGAAIIGFSASASVDWLLNRTDEALNRAGFEVNVHKAVIAAQADFESKATDAQQRSIERQLRAITAALTGQISSQ